MTDFSSEKTSFERGLRPPLSLPTATDLTAKGGISAELSRHGAKSTKAVMAFISKGNETIGPQASYSSEKTAPLPAPSTRKKDKRQLSNRAIRKRQQASQEAVKFAYQIDLPPSVMITITWGACTYGDREEGHILALPDQERVQRLIRLLRASLRSLGYPLALIWARDVGHRMGAHCHCLMYWPVHHLRELVQILEKLTGDRAETVNVPYTFDLFARSGSGGWQVNMVRTDVEGAISAADYIATQPLQHPERLELDGRIFGISREIGGTARKKSNPA